MRQSETDMAEQIFAATERLMAKDGLHHLSMHKIAKEARISAGTIYIYFKSKEELLEQFAWRVFSLFQTALEKDYDETLSYFEQYKKMWLNVWYFLQDNPNIVMNMQQYQSLPGFFDICKEMDYNSRWATFCQKAQQAGAVCELSVSILFSLSMESAMNLAFKKLYINEFLADEELITIIERTWRSIQK